MIRRVPAWKACGDKRVRQQEEGAPAPRQKQACVLVGEQKEPRMWLEPSVCGLGRK